MGSAVERPRLAASGDFHFQPAFVLCEGVFVADHEEVGSRSCDDSARMSLEHLAQFPPAVDTKDVAVVDLAGEETRAHHIADGCIPTVFGDKIRKVGEEFTGRPEQRHDAEENVAALAGDPEQFGDGGVQYEIGPP